MKGAWQGHGEAHPCSSPSLGALALIQAQYTVLSTVQCSVVSIARRIVGAGVAIKQALVDSFARAFPLLCKTLRKNRGILEDGFQVEPYPVTTADQGKRGSWSACSTTIGVLSSRIRESGMTQGALLARSGGEGEARER